MKYSDPAPGWTTELIATFVFGFVLATLLWVGLWFFKTKPGYAATLQARETALRECVAVKNECSDEKNKARAVNESIIRQLEEARLGWGRCLKSKKALEEKLQP